jgi:hypothetical protein
MGWMQCDTVIDYSAATVAVVQLYRSNVDRLLDKSMPRCSWQRPADSQLYRAGMKERYKYRCSGVVAATDDASSWSSREVATVCVCVCQLPLITSGLCVRTGNNTCHPREKMQSKRTTANSIDSKREIQ